MNILYIDHYAGSISMGMEFRPFYLAREWMKMGHNVRIIGADYSHLRKSNPIVSKDLEIQIVDGVEFQWLKTLQYEGNGIKRAITMFEFCWKLWRFSKKVVRDFFPDVVISSSTYPLDNYPARRIGRIANCKVVHEIHDMWPITLKELYGMPSYHPFVVIMQIAENSFCRYSDEIVSILPCAKKYLIDHGMFENKFHYISNGICVDEWKTNVKIPITLKEKIEKARRENRFVIGFYGSHTRSYALDYLVQAIAECESDRLFLVFVGEGNYKKELISLVKQLKMDENAYHFSDPIGKDQIPDLVRNLDASYVGALKNDMFRFGIGMNKLFDAMMGQKPILYAVEAPNNIVEKYNCGISVQAENVNALKEGICQLLTMSRENRELLGNNGRIAVIQNFTYPIIAQKFIEIIKEKKQEVRK